MNRIERHLNPKPSAPKPSKRDVERLSVLFSNGRRVIDFEILTSPDYLDPAKHPGWLVKKVNTGWIAVKLVN